jgi:hypothetical protein
LIFQETNSAGAGNKLADFWKQSDEFEFQTRGDIFMLKL